MAFLKQEAPEFESGTAPEDKLNGIADFLMQHMEELQYVLRHLSGENFTETVWKGIQSGGTQSGGSMKKLWENPAPGSRMGRTDMTIAKIAGYDVIGVEFAWAATTPYAADRCIWFTPYIEGTSLRAVHIYHGAQDEICSRSVKLNADGVTFYAAIDETGESSDFWMIPTAVYGIKL